MPNNRSSSYKKDRQDPSKLAIKWTRNDLLIPMISIAVFFFGAILILWSFNQVTQEQRQERLVHSASLAQQQIQLSLSNIEVQLSNLAIEIQREQHNPYTLQKIISKTLEKYPEIDSLNWYVNPKIRRQKRLLPPSTFNNYPPKPEDIHFANQAFSQAKAFPYPHYTRLYAASDNSPPRLINFQIPIIENQQIIGLLISSLSIDNILKHDLPNKLSQKYFIVVVDQKNRVLASTANYQLSKNDHYFLELPLNLKDYHLTIRIYALQNNRFSEEFLFWIIAAICCFILWSLWHYTKQRNRSPQAIYSETFFQRSIENANLIGMRTLDMQGKIIHVNPTFCRLTGWDQEELVGQMPPYPYWPKDQYAQMQRHIDMTLAGKVPSSGLEAQILRKDGTTFHARFYVSPVIDSQGHQTGWISSVTDITERLKVREELTAAHERFTTVLESLHAAVSVLASNQAELLFANLYYRQLFGIRLNAHLALTQTTAVKNEKNDFNTDLAALNTLEETETSSAQHLENDKLKVQEVFIEEVNKWFEVRTQSIRWVDGSLAQLQISTDITDRKHEQEKARQEEEKLQFTSRLVTMGEMASSIAHELNQPLAAISNYCSGAIALLNNQQISKESLMPTLQKTAQQAIKAGMIVKRIRAFVKRSEPKRQPAKITDIIADAIGLAEIEAHRRWIRIVSKIHSPMPLVCVDPVLIEQVLVNLIKNAAEAMSEKQNQNTDAIIQVQAQVEGSFIKISVIDQGHGVDESTTEKLFEPFYSTKANGMGMGLNICRSIIEMHNGRLWVLNQLDKEGQILGAIFHCTLPVATHNSTTSIPHRVYPH